jgi:sterol desaturase/sphingolipid hydroxylase (fatty acid hydroxylase superfamily)
MEWVDWVLSREFRQFILDNGLFFWLLFLARVVGVTALELVAPARSISYRSVIVQDVTAFLFYQFVVLSVAGILSSYVAIRASIPDVIMALPVWVRFIMYFIVGDFGAYWLHRLLHTRHLWRAHKWHHSPTTMYWLGAGVRASILQQAIFNLPWIFAYPLFNLAPWWMGLAVVTVHTITNDWMHMNVTWRSNWLEWIIVTPRSHHIHHSENPIHYQANFGVIFSLWDRVFGTYVPPDSVKTPLTFGIGERVPLVRLVLGV